MAATRLASIFDVEYLNISYLEILYTVRNYIHNGHKLITHPLSGSVKPKETPYKSVVISREIGSLCMQSLSIIEESVACYSRFADRHIPEAALQDFMEIDYSLIRCSAPAPLGSGNGQSPIRIESSTQKGV